MSQEVVVDPSSTSVVVDDWDNDDGDDSRQQQLQERFQQVKILKREKAAKEARIEEAKAAEANEGMKTIQSSEGMCSESAIAAAMPPMKMQILRRPQSGAQLAKEAEMARKEQEEKKKAGKPTFEQRQAAYDEARSRILGSDYKPDPPAAQPQTTPTVASSSRNKSPEQIRVRRPSPETVPVYTTPSPAPQPLQQSLVDSMAGVGLGGYSTSDPMGGRNTMGGYSTSDPMGGRNTMGSYSPSDPMGVRNTMGSYSTTGHMGSQMNFMNQQQPTPQSYLPYFDTSRPPPAPIPTCVASPGMGMYPSGPPIGQCIPTGQYFPVASPMQMHHHMQQQQNTTQQQQQQQPMAMNVPFGRPPMALFPPGSLGAAMQVNIDPRLPQSQRKGKKGGGAKKNQAE